MGVLYNNRDITDEAPFEKCEHDMYIQDRADTLMIAFENADGQWSKWAPQVGDTIRVTQDYDDTGVMYVNSIKAVQSLLVINAASIKGPLIRKAKAWSQVGLLQLLKYIAGEHGLEVKTYGVQDQRYSYVRQDNEDDFSFLNRRLALEGCAFLVYNGVLTAYSYDFMEDLAIGTALLEADDESIRIQDDAYYGSCSVSNGGEFDGKYTEDADLEGITAQLPVPFDSISDANRYAEKYLQRENLTRKIGVVYSEAFESNISAGTKLTLASTYWPKAPVIITHVRHNLSQSQSKIWFRRCRDG